MKMTNSQRTLGAFVCALALGSCGQGNGKHDIFDFSPGMTKAEFESAILAHKGTCEPVLAQAQPNSVFCRIDAGQLTAAFAKSLKDSPIISVQVIYGPRTGLPCPTEAEIDRISTQFGKKPDQVQGVGNVVQGGVWNLDGGNVLYGNGCDVMLNNEGLQQQDLEAAKANLRRATPETKF